MAAQTIDQAHRAGWNDALDELERTTLKQLDPDATVTVPQLLHAIRVHKDPGAYRDGTTLWPIREFHSAVGVKV